MDKPSDNFTGIWLDAGNRQGEPFSHEAQQFDHDQRSEDGGSTPMRHAVVEREGQKIGVWVPASWTDAQALEALENNW